MVADRETVGGSEMPRAERNEPVCRIAWENVAATPVRQHQSSSRGPQPSPAPRPVPDTSTNSAAVSNEACIQLHWLVRCRMTGQSGVLIF